MRKLLAVALACLAPAGCGGDDDGSSEKEAFIEKGDRICIGVNEKLGAINGELVALEGPPERRLPRSAPLYRRSVRIQQQAIDEFRTLEVPEEDKETIEGYLDAAQNQIGVLERLADAAEEADVGAVRSASTQLEQLSQRRRFIISEYGFEHCGGAQPEEK